VIISSPDNAHGVLGCVGARGMPVAQAAPSVQTPHPRFVIRLWRVGYASCAAGHVRQQTAHLPRLSVPFGILIVPSVTKAVQEHTSFVRAATRTDINEDQQDVLALAIAQESWRAEAMVIIGNYSLRPNAFRERELAGFVEATLSPHFTLGASALATRADAAFDTKFPTLRHSSISTSRACGRL